MSAAAPASPAVIRTSSTSRRSQGIPHRAQSTTTRPSTNSSSTPQRTLSHSHAHGRPPSSQQANIANVARRDFEQQNLAQPPSSRRSESREGPNPPLTPSRADSIKSGAHQPPHPRHTRYASDASTTNSATPQTSSRTSAAAPPSSSNRGRRTTIEAPTGLWALGKTIGAGSMGKVKLAQNAETREQVAVKIIARYSTDEHRTQADRERADHSKEIRTAREAAIVGLVNHPYISGLRDVVRTNYHWYMLFEYVNGGQMLDYIISHGRLKEKQARRFGRQIASALDYCHRNSIVHRDLKIENILISKTGDIKIIDFGLSNLFAPKSHLKTFCGSLYFAAPELLQAKHYTGPEVDVWSFGIVLYVLVCGKVPFDDQSMPQLHAKIKKGNVEYPPWLTAECKNLISRMLVTDSKQRASLSEIMNHPWMTKGYNGPPENFLPYREPLQLPLDPEVIQRMTGFDFGSPEFITSELTKVLESEEYQNSARQAARKQAVAQTPETEQKRGVFNFYKRRNSTTSRDTLTNLSADTLQLGQDPINAYSPLISIYFLVREKIQRERTDANAGALTVPTEPGEKPLKLPELPAPQAAYTNPQTYEMVGEAPTGGRSRPRARTHGEDDVTDDMKRLQLNVPAGPVSPAIITPPVDHMPAKKESTAGALLRRFSTRRHKETPREKEHALSPPAVAVSGPAEAAGSVRKSFSVRRPRERETPSSLQPPSTTQQPELLTPPSAGVGAARKLKALGRSTSVNSAELRRRMTRRGAANNEPPPTSGSDRASERSSISDQRPLPEDAASDEAPITVRRAPTSRAKSLGHARRESIQARRARRDNARENEALAETDAEGYEGAPLESRSPDTMKPVYLKGLFSVSTTSSKPLSFIRSDIIRVLKQLGVEYHEIKGGFSCRHSPSIDIHKAQEPLLSPMQSSAAGPVHRRKISFGGFKGSDRERERDEFRDAHKSPQTPRSTASRQRSGAGGDFSFTNSEVSDESDTGREESRHPTKSSRPRAAGETTTHVQSDLGNSMLLEFEIVIVKVPLLSLHGIQFKKVDGGTWQYKNMAQKILDGLKL